ncbi:MAG: hypothetical protein GY769_08475 [bacterium]|nr:hypothetical protein [bacterium]
MSSYSISPGVRKTLEESFVEQRDLIDGLREHRGKEDPSEPGVYLCSFLMTVRRPMDLETAVRREVRVRMRAVGDGYEVIAVQGLGGELAG